MCAERAGDLNFPFEQIASAMRFIDDVMVPVIVAKEEARPGEVELLIRDLRFATGVGRIARQLGRYTVGVPRKVRGDMIAKGVAEVIRPEEFGDQFVVLHNLDLYAPETGLEWDDVTFRNAGAMIARTPGSPIESPVWASPNNSWSPYRRRAAWRTRAYWP